MDNSKNVQLHEIIKNSLATYLSYKWSSDKLYLKKRKNKGEKSENQKNKKACSLAKQRSVINLENNVFIYNAKDKTFTQLDLCDCFKNGLKYRRIDPFATKSNKKKYELCQSPQHSPEDLREYQSFQLLNVRDSVEHIFSNRMMKKGPWTETLNNLSPSKFDFLIQEELNKCSGRNFDVKSFKINTKQETSTSSNDKVCSSAAIGYYTITTFDDALQSKNQTNRKGKKMSTKQCNFVGIREESITPKKLYSKSLQCKISNRNQQKKENVSPKKDLGVQCYYTPMQNTIEKSNIDQNRDQNTEIRCQNRKSPVLRHKNLNAKKPLRKRHGSLSDLFPPTECQNVGNMLQINSSAEIRRMLNDERSDSSFNLSSTREYFRTFMKPKPLMTYYQTSSTSKENRGDTNDEMYIKNEPIIRVVSAPNEQLKKSEVVTTVESKQISPICSIHCKKNYIPKVPSCACTYEDTKHKVPVQKSISGPKIVTVCSSKCIGPCSALRKTASTHACPSNCPCSGQKNVEMRDSKVPCVCPDPPRKACCECNREILTTGCICDLLCNLKERIRMQTEEQNRNLDQILEELDKQDREIQLIRQYVEKSRKTKKNKCCKKNAVCSCYAATVEYDFNSNPRTEKQKVEDNIEHIYGRNIDVMRQAEPDIIEIFGSEKKFDSRKHIYNVFEKDSWKALFKKNSKVFCVNDIFKKRNHIRNKLSSSSDGQNENLQMKKNKKWFSKLVCSKKDLRKNVS